MITNYKLSKCLILAGKNKNERTIISGTSILEYCGEMIPKLKTRVDKANKPHGSGESSGGGGGGKKKNKKR